MIYKKQHDVVALRLDSEICYLIFQLRSMFYFLTFTSPRLAGASNDAL